jgi:hypothetical protein
MIALPDRISRRLIVAALLLLSVVLSVIGKAQGTGTSFWLRLAPDASIRSDVVAVIDFFPDREPLVRTNTSAATGREIEDLKSTLISVKKAHQGAFPVGRRLVIARASQPGKPDTARADTGGRRQLIRLREIEQKSKLDPNVAPFIMTLVVDQNRIKQ